MQSICPVSSPERFRLAARDPPFRRPAFGTLMVAAMLLTAGPFAATAYTQLWLQSVLVLSPIDPGLVLAPMAIVSFAVSLSVGRFMHGIGPRLPLGGGLSLIGAGRCCAP